MGFRVTNRSKFPPSTPKSREKQEAILSSGLETFRGSGGSGGRQLTPLQQQLLDEAQQKQQALQQQIAQDKITEQKQAEQQRLEGVRNRIAKEQSDIKQLQEFIASEQMQDRVEGKRARSVDVIIRDERARVDNLNRIEASKERFRDKQGFIEQGLAVAKATEPGDVILTLSETGTGKGTDEVVAIKGTYSKSLTPFQAVDKLVSDKIPTLTEIKQNLLSGIPIGEKDLSITQQPLQAGLPPTGKQLFLQEAFSQSLQKDLKKSKAQIFAEGGAVGAFEQIRTKPVSTVATGALVGIGLGGVGLAASGIGSTAVGIAEVGAITGGIVLGTAFVGKTAVEIGATPGASGKGEIFGRKLTEAVQFGGGLAVGTKTFNTGFDIVRTARMKEVSSTEVIAPEFLAGQKFPSVKSGQTIGQLKAEFSQPSLPSEVAGVPRGFTASPGGFQKITTVTPGTSEVPGLFSAPKVSPHFLKITKAERGGGIGTNFLLSEPTTIRLTFNTLDLLPGIKGTQKVGSVGNLGSFKAFFEGQRGTGRTFVPGAKTEKEAITVADTIIQQTGSNLFFKFEGRRVPIKEFGIVGGGQQGLTLGSVTRSASSSRIGSGFSPTKLIQLPSSSSSVSSSISRVTTPTSSSISSGISSGISSSVSRGSSSTSRFSRSSRIISTPEIISSSSSGRSTSRGLTSSLITSSSSSSRRSRRVPNPPPPPPPPFIRFKPVKTKQGRGDFTVSVRRFGKFKTIGTGLGLSKAIEVGRGRVGRTLAATFRVTPSKPGRTTGGLRTPTGFRTKATKKGTLFIEQRGLRLSTRGETGEIKVAKRRRK